MKNNYKIGMICLMSVVALLLSNCKKSELPGENSLKVNNKSLACAGCGENDLLGYGYDVSGEFANSSASKFSIVDVDRLKAEQPTRVEWDLSSKKYGEIIAGESASSYLSSLSDKLGAGLSIKDPNATDPKVATVPLFKGSIDNTFSNTNSYSSKYVYSNYSLKIQQKRVKFNADKSILQQYLTSSFIADVKAQSPQYIVSAYGTHVLKDIILGAKLDITYRAQTTSSDRKDAATRGIDFNILGIFSINTQTTNNTQQTKDNTNQRLSFKAIGGEPSSTLTANIVIGSTLPTISTAQWENSSTLSNAEMIDIPEAGLIPIWDLIADPIKSAAVKNYVTQYLISRQFRELGDVPIYSHYNAKSADHYFTPNSQATIAPGFVREGIEFQAFSVPGQDLVPIYSHYNAKSADHYFTPNAQNIGYGFVRDGVAFYAYTSPGANRIPIYSHYNARNTDHYFTPNTQNIGYGFVREGIAFYAPN